MNRNMNLALALAAGLVGGILSRYLAPTPVLAQAQITNPKEIRAENFVIVDENGAPRGAFGIDRKDGWPTLEITDAKGHAWRARFYSVSFFHKAKPDLLPPQ
jgi:hypothetical protein